MKEVPGLLLLTDREEFIAVGDAFSGRDFRLPEDQALVNAASHLEQVEYEGEKCWSIPATSAEKFIARLSDIRDHYHQIMNPRSRADRIDEGMLALKSTESLYLAADGLVEALQRLSDDATTETLSTDVEDGGLAGS